MTYITKRCTLGGWLRCGFLASDAIGAGMSGCLGTRTRSPGSTLNGKAPIGISLARKPYSSTYLWPRRRTCAMLTSLVEMDWGGTARVCLATAPALRQCRESTKGRGVYGGEVVARDLSPRAGHIKVAVLRPVQVPMRENDLQTLATRLAHIYPVQERRPGGSGVALMNPAVRKSVIVEMPRLLISEDYVPDTNRSVESIETALNEAMSRSP